MSATVCKALWVRPPLVGSRLRCRRVHVKSPEKQRETDNNVDLQFDPLEKSGGRERPQKIHCGLFAFCRQFRLCACPFLPSKAFTLKPVINRISYQVVKGVLVVKRKLKSCLGWICVRVAADGIISHTRNLVKFFNLPSKCWQQGFGSRVCGENPGDCLS